MSSDSGKSIRKNYIYNVCYQIMLLLTPVITAPYLARVLGADGVGVVSFAESIVSYFVLFASFGMTTYGQREISYVQDNKEKRTIVFWETVILEVITSIIALGIYIPFAFSQKNRLMYLVLSLNIVAVVANVTWFFQGIEEFGKIVFRNVIFKAINIIYIFVFVKTRKDIVVYAFGMAFFLLLSNISLWFYLPKYIGKTKIKNLHPMCNIRTVISLFIPTIAVQVYTVLDKTMIGVITQNSFENGYYEQAIKISKTALTLVTSLGIVMVPRIGYHFAKKETGKVNLYMFRAYQFVWLLGIPLCFGLIGIAPNFVPWFYGAGYDKVIPLLSILALLILAIGISNVTGVQYLIPTQRQNLFTMTVIIGAMINFIFNLILIQRFQSIGAAISSVVAEFTITIVQIFLVRNELSPKKIIGSSFHYLIAGSIMLIVVKVMGVIMTSSIIHTIELIVIGGTIYICVLVIMKDYFFIENVKNVLSKVRGVLSKF